MPIIDELTDIERSGKKRELRSFSGLFMSLPPGAISIEIFGTTNDTGFRDFRKRHLNN